MDKLSEIERNVINISVRLVQLEERISKIEKVTAENIEVTDLLMETREQINNLKFQLD